MVGSLRGAVAEADPTTELAFLTSALLGGHIAGAVPEGLGTRQQLVAKVRGLVLQGGALRDQVAS